MKKYFPSVKKSVLFFFLESSQQLILNGWVIVDTRCDRKQVGRRLRLIFVYRQFALLCSKIMEQKSFAESSVSGSSWRRVININELSRNYNYVEVQG